MSDPNAPLVTPEWLAERLASPGLVVVDGSWHLPATGRDPHAEHAAGRIPGAVFFDIEAISDRTSALPHMLPDADAFSAAMEALGIGADDLIVVYDAAGVFSAPRVWWTLRVFGARDVRVLDGGLPAWAARGLPIETDAPAPRARSRFPARLAKGAVADFETVRVALASGGAQVADARPAARFRGEAPEPRAGVRSGHMPGARSLPATDLLQDGRMADRGTILAAFARAGVDPDKPIVTSCGSGVSAAIVNLALAVAGKPEAALYDGSWTEWAGRPEAPKAP